MDNELVRVTLELDLVNGTHFNPSDKPLTKDQLIEAARGSFIDWLDSWCQEEDKSTLEEYIQVKVIE